MQPQKELTAGRPIGVRAMLPPWYAYELLLMLITGRLY